ncbi:MAG TPA: histidine kinase [Telluria sp.]|nr:histidine kinase [Telluria sp.]
MKRFPYKRFLEDGVWLLAFSSVAAMAIVTITGAYARFPITLTFSLCIGLAALFLVDGFRLWMWGAVRAPDWRILLPVCLLAAPLAQTYGSRLALLLLGLQELSADKPFSPRWYDSVLFTALAIIAAMCMLALRDRLEHARAAAANERARAERIERQAVQAQLMLLQAQLEPHMLFNTLANLQGLIAFDPPRAQQMLDQLIQYLRATLSASRTELTTLATEFALIEAYLGLMSVRMGTRLSYALELPEDLRSTRVPPMLLQPLVENAIGHGLEPKVEGGRVTVRAARGAAAIVLTVADDGRGPDATPGRTGTRLGLANTRERLAALFGEQAALTLEAAHPSGALATIHLPITP